MATKASSIPSREQNDQDIVGWCTEAIREGESFLRSQTGYDKIPDIIDSIMGESKDDLMRPSSMSNINLNHCGKIGLDLASSLTDVKPFWEYKVNNKNYEQQATQGQKLATGWWTNQMIDLKFCDVIKYALAGGSGYAHLVWNKEIQDQDLIPEDPRDVFPIRPGDLLSIQSAFGQVIRRERTVNYLKAKYPEKAQYIKADRDGSYAAMSKNTRAAKISQMMGLGSGFVQNLFSSLGGKPQAASLNVPVADEFTIYVKDDSVNQTGEAVVMGDPDTNWSYIVQPGDALYPRKRCIVLTRSCKLYDGPNPYWHGMFPAPKLTLDPWPWSWLGKSPMKDILGIQKEIAFTARGISDLFQKNWRPDLIADKNAISKALVERLDTRRAGLKLRHNPMAGQGIQLVYPTNIQTIELALNWLQFLISEQKELSGTQELSSLIQLGQIPATETIERMLESMSPSVRLRSRVMEAFMRELAKMVLMNFFQFYDLKKRVAVLGQQGITFDDFDSDPGTMIPDEQDEYGRSLPRAERAAKFIDMFTYSIAPGSLLNAASVTNKLMYLQLTRMGACDFITLLEKMEVGNIGAPAEAGNTIFERLQWQMQNGIGQQPGPASGRKATGQQMPRIKISESG